MGEVIAFLLFTLLVMLLFSAGVAWLICAAFHLVFSLPCVFAVWSIWIVILLIINHSKEE